MIKPKIKICGIKNIETLNCCIKNNIDYFGLIFYNKSPRYIKIQSAQKLIAFSKNKKISSVGVFVNEPINDMDSFLKNINLKYLQLHGEEDNEYIKAVKKNNIKVIKVISIRTSRDLLKISTYPDADLFLFDYKPIKNELPGGNAKTFNWEIINDIKIKKPWFLSGGININNIKEIKKFAIPYGIDISSGVEVNSGNKSNKKITSLIKSYEKE